MHKTAIQTQHFKSINISRLFQLYMRILNGYVKQRFKSLSKFTNEMEFCCSYMLFIRVHVNRVKHIHSCRKNVFVVQQMRGQTIYCLLELTQSWTRSQIPA